MNTLYLCEVRNLANFNMEIFTIFYGDWQKEDFVAICCTNKRTLAYLTGIGYSKLVGIFTRQKRNYYKDPEKGINIILSKILHKGKQRVIARKSNTTYVRNM